MAELILTVFLDALMAILLIITVVYCARLNSRIRVLQDSKSELAKIIREFDTSTHKAMASIADIHEATARIAENMQHKIDKANYIADDLQFMIEKGGKVAERMGGPTASKDDEEIRARRSTSKERSMKAPREGARANEEAQSQSRATLDSMLKRVRGGKEKESAPAPEGEVMEPAGSRPRRQGARLRSKAEQELFEALKAGGSKG